MSVFDILRDQLHMIFASVTEIMSGKVSLDRMNKFLHEVRLIAVTPHYNQLNALRNRPNCLTLTLRKGGMPTSSRRLRPPRESGSEMHPSYGRTLPPTDPSLHPRGSFLSE